ncbi:MAG TPA: hypothetical protein VIM84_07235 [Gemmatimonadales bacterium]
MFSCDYNGWTDMREEEREALEDLETPPQSSTPAAVTVLVVPQLPAAVPPFRKAA